MREKQKRFADEYLIELNAAGAYKAVYFQISAPLIFEGGGFE